MNKERMVLIGLHSMADYCGVSLARVRDWMAENPDFPVRREGRKGGFISTSGALMDWLDRYVSRGGGKPAPPEAKRPKAARKRGGLRSTPL